MDKQSYHSAVPSRYSNTVQDKSDRERKLMRDVFKDTRTPAKTLVNDLAKYGIVLSKKTITGTLHRNVL